MRTNFKILAVITILGAISLSAFAKAALTPSAAPETNSIFCSKISQYLDKIDSAVKDKFGSINSKRDEISQKLSQKDSDLENKLKDNREKWDENKEEAFLKAEEIAKTEAQKQALIAFKERIEAAVLKRRTAIDSAIEKYQEGVKKIIADRKADVDGLSASYQSALKEAFEKIKAECSNAGVKSLKDTLKDLMKTAREKYTTDRQNIEKVGDLIKPLIDERKEAMKKAQDEFKTELEAAKTDLKKAFGE